MAITKDMINRLIIEIEDSFRRHPNNSNFVYCKAGVSQVLDVLKSFKNMPATTNNNKTINLPEPTPEMLHALRFESSHIGGDFRVENYDKSNTNFSISKHDASLTRYNRLKEILARPATKTVTMYVVTWMTRDGTPDGYTMSSQDVADGQLRRINEAGLKHGKITEIQQTVDDTTNS